MAITLNIVDNGNGSGGVANIAGSDAGSANTVYYAPFSGPQGTLTWFVAGTRTGDGAVTVTSIPGSPGPFFWYATGVVSASPAVSSVIYAALTDQTQAVHYRCLLAVQQRIIGLELCGMPAGNVVIARAPLTNGVPVWQAITELPCVVIMPFGNEGQPGTLNSKDDIQYPVLVALVALPEGPTQKLPRDLLWRERVFRAFRHQRLLGVPEIQLGTDIETRPVTDPLWWGKNNWYSAMLLKPCSREKRG